MDLAAAFLAHAGAHRDRLAAAGDLGERLGRMLAAARSAWPGLAALPDLSFLRHVAERLPADDDPLAALTEMEPHAGDLLVACGCAAGLPAAVRAFEDGYLAQVEGYLARSHASASFAAEVKQTLRTRLLVGEDGRPPRITGYGGQGPLGGWLRMTAARQAIDLWRAQQRESAREREPVFAVRPAAPDPELEALKVRWREEFEAAFEATLRALGPREANVLRLYFLNAMTAEAIGGLYQVSARTVQRWIADARQGVLDGTRRRLAERLDLSVSQLGTVMGLVQSRLDVSIRSLLERPGAGQGGG